MAFDRIKKAVMQTLERLVHEQYPESWHQTVTRTSIQPQDLKNTSYERRIIELADGRPIYDIVETIYREELLDGGWISDIGLWKHLWDKEVVKTIGDLAEKGYIELGQQK